MPNDVCLVKFVADAPGVRRVKGRKRTSTEQGWTVRAAGVGRGDGLTSQSSARETSDMTRAKQAEATQ
jgi:hypothetical protein